MVPPNAIRRMIIALAAAAALFSYAPAAMANHTNDIASGAECPEGSETHACNGGAGNFECRRASDVSKLTCTDASGQQSGAVTSPRGGSDSSSTAPILSIPIPNLHFGEVTVTELGGTRITNVPYLANYIAAVYNFAIGIASVIAAIMMMVGGFRWLTAGGDAGRVSAAKENIQNAIVGLGLALGAYAILYVVNPDLTAMRALEIASVEQKLFEVSPGEIPPEGVTAPGVGTNGVPLFQQCDKEWRDIKPGDERWPFTGDTTGCTSICQRACGTTSLAMVLSKHGISTDPVDTAKWGLGCQGGWSVPRTLDAIGQKWPGMVGEAIYKGSNPTKAVDKMIGIVSNGMPVIYNCHPCDGTTAAGGTKNYGGHYMVLTGYDSATKRFQVNDPGSVRGIVSMSYDEVLNGFNVAAYVHPK